MLSGFAPELDGRWIVTTATHTISDAGYVTSIEAKRATSEAVGASIPSPGSDGRQTSEKRLDDQGGHTGQQQAEHPLQQRELAVQVAAQHIEIAAQ